MMRQSGLWFPLLMLLNGPGYAVGGALTDVEQLGRSIFFDAGLSDPPGQSCASCHAPQAGWTGPDSAVNAKPAAYAGAVHGRFGNRKPPSAAYTSQTPALRFDSGEGLFIGGLFWNGRATGWLLGSAVADQAQQPFLNPVEQNNAGAQAVVDKVCAGNYGERFRATFGSEICADVVSAYNAIAQALAAFEASSEVNAFSSKYDYYLRAPDAYPLTAQERLGMELYEREDKGNCAACHPHQAGPHGEPPLFTDFTYDNLGLPVNPDNPWYAMPPEFNPEGRSWIDQGLGGFLRSVPRFASRADTALGKQRVPTLRNVDKRPTPEFVKAYGHNGYFKSLEDIVHFYNTRDVLAACEELNDPQPAVNCWPRPEVKENVNVDELGDLGLTAEEEQAIVAFLRSLSDGWRPDATARASP